ncbi:sema domain protein, partial [Ostertagia ostertagi]
MFRLARKKLSHCGSPIDHLDDVTKNNIFTRGDLDYRNLVLDANSASLYVGARGRIFRLWAYNVNDTSENLVCSAVAMRPEIRVLDAVTLRDRQEPRTEIVYSGIRTGMAGENHLIYRPALVDKGKEVHSSLRKPQFVGSFDVGEHVYFFFREIAIESGGPERSVYSRVARVCKKTSEVALSYVKLDIVSESTSELFHFVTVPLFHHGFFVDPNSPNWLPLPADAVPEHRPGTCVSNSHSLSDSDLHFAKSHLLMAEPVSGGMPILATRDVIFTHIAVDVRSEQNVIFALDG